MPFAPESQKTPSGSTLAGAVLLCCVTAIAYFPALRNGYVWDDDMLVTGNSLIKSVSGLHKIWFTTESADYWPVTLTAFWVQWRLWGLDALGYHAVNLALHIAEALLLWAVLRQLRIPGAYLAAFIFAVHPVNVETVAWISELKNLMAMLFFLATIWFFIKSEIASPSPIRRSPAARDEGGPSSRWYALSLLCFLLAMLSKGSVAILPLILLGIIAWRRPINRRDLARLAPFFAVSVALAAVDVWFQRHGTLEVFRHAGFLERLLGAGAAVWFYLGKALWPAHLTFVYPEWHIRTADPLWWIPLLAAIAVTLALWCWDRGWSRAVLFSWGFFCVGLAPVMGFTDVYFMKYSLVANRYEHLAIIGVIGLVAAGWGGWQKAESERRKAKNSAFRFSPAAAGAAICVLSILTWRQCGNYRDARTLFLANLEQNPRSWLAYGYLGSTPPSADRPDGIAYLERALAIKPDYADAHYNLGVALGDAGRLPEAIAQYEEAVRLKPDYVEAHNNLGGALRDTGRTAEAIDQFIQTLRLDPGYYLAENNLANLLVNTPGGLSQAIVHYEAAARLSPDSAAIQANLGYALAAAGRLPEAIAHDEDALRIDPGSAAVRYNLGEALLREGRTADAEVQFREAARLRGNR